MAVQGQLNRVQQQYTSAKSLVVLIPQDATLDAYAAGLAFHLSLIESGKRSTLVTPKLPQFVNALPENTHLTTQFTGRNLVVSWPYPEDSVDQVATEVDPQQHKFNIVIQTKPGFPPIDYRQLEFRYIGIDADTVFTVSGTYPEDFPEFQSELRELADQNQSRIWFIDNASPGSQQTISDPGATSLSEVVFKTIQQLKLPLTSAVATNILIGIEAQTQQLTQGVTADTFEAMAACMRAGGVRRSVSSPSSAPSTSQTPPRPQQSQPMVPPRPQTQTQPKPQSPQSSSQPAASQLKPSPIPAPASNSAPSAESQPQEPSQPEQAPATPATPPANHSSKPNIPQPEWLIPKAFK